MEKIFEELSKLYEEAEQQREEQPTEEELEAFIENIFKRIKDENKKVSMENINQQQHNYDSRWAWESPEAADIDIKSFTFSGDHLVELLDDYLSPRGMSDYIGDFYELLEKFFNKAWEDITKEEIANFDLDKFLNWFATNYRQSLVDYIFDYGEQLHYEDELGDMWSESDFSIMNDNDYEEAARRDWLD